MASSSLPTRLSYFVETTQGSAPADWDASGTSVRHIMESLDVSVLQQSMLEDERSQEEILAYDQMIFGIKGGGDIEFSFSAYLHGHGDTTGTDETSPTATGLSGMLGNALGATTLGEHTTIVAGGGTTSATVLDCDTVDGLEAGDIVGVADADGNLELRPIDSIASTALTLKYALSFTPDGADRVYSAITASEDEDTLEDSSTGPYTTSWLIEVGRGSGQQAWECRGCKLYLTGIELARNTPPKLNFTVKVGSFDTPETASGPTWSSDPVGAAGLAIGPNTEVNIQDFGTTTRNCVKAVEMSFTNGVTPMPVPTLTECDDGMPGIGMYSLERQPTEFTLHVAPHSDDWYTDFNAQTLKHVAITRKAPLGSAWMIYFPRAEITQTPQYGTAGNLLNTMLSLRALKDDGSTDPSSSRVLIGMC